ncbi:hypothetical protein HDU77_007689 [Chytriomyces hyalinus]|nr:hypothetical protein HDU77_007689 [Chytriomyces hyalinus]
MMCRHLSTVNLWMESKSEILRLFKDGAPHKAKRILAGEDIVIRVDLGLGKVKTLITMDASSQFKSRRWTIPVLLLVFVQMFLVAAIVLIIPLVISYSAMLSSNELSASTGRNVTHSLAVKIQSAEASLALESINSLIKAINEKTLHMHKAISAYNNQSNIDSIFYSFANEVKYTKYDLVMYYGSPDNAYIMLQKSGPKSVWITTPIGYNNPDCRMCQYYQQNYTAINFELAGQRNGSAAWGDWDEDSWVFSNFRYDNTSYYCTRRPWYQQAARLSPDNVYPQYTSPYIFAGGTSNLVAGITVARRLTGVYGSDLSFTEMHDMLRKLLQTENSFMYVMTRDGMIVGTSTNESLVDLSTNNLIHANESSSPLTRSTAQYLWALESKSDQRDFTKFDGERWDLEDLTFQLVAMKEAPYLVIVNGAPKNDYAESINRVQQDLEETGRHTVRKSIGISAVGFLLVVAISCFVFYFSVARPLAIITSRMVNATQFEISAFRDANVQHSTFIKELAGMESEFNQMVSKFAESVLQTQNIYRVGTDNAFVFRSETTIETIRRKKSLVKDGKKAHRPVSLLWVVFLQTFVVAAVVLVIPLVIFLSAIAKCNSLSVAAGTGIANTLAIRIQNLEVSLVMESIGSLIASINENALDMSKIVSVYGNNSNLDSLLYSFANEIKYSNYPLSMYFGTKSGAFVYLKGTGKDSIWVTTPLGFSDPGSRLCETYQQNYTASDWEWVRKRNSSTGFGAWDQDSWAFSGFYHANLTFIPTARPWYRQAARITSFKNAKVQYTEPYIYGSDGKKGFGVAGISSNYPFFDANGQMSGVYGTDISFADMHGTLSRYLNTPNSFMYCITRSGQLVGTSSKESILSAAGGMKFANESITETTKLTAEFLWDLVPNEGIDFTLLSGRLWEHEGYLFQVRAMEYAPYFVVVNGAPKSDYTGDIDLMMSDLEIALSRNVVLILGVSIAVFAIMVTINCALAYYLINAPIGKITSILRSASSFDFVAYKTMQSQYGNYISELSAMEKVFYTMIAKFAGSIRSSEPSKSRTSDPNTNPSFPTTTRGRVTLISLLKK